MLWVSFFKYSHLSQVQFKILVSTALSDMDMVSLFSLPSGGAGDRNSKQVAATGKVESALSQHPVGSESCARTWLRVSVVTGKG